VSDVSKYRSKYPTNCDGCAELSDLEWCGRLRVFVNSYTKKKYWSVICTMDANQLQEKREEVIGVNGRYL
jgi:hypothetical protein